jgi:hypothetical protein
LELLLLAACLAIFGLAVSSLAFSAACRRGEEVPELQRETSRTPAAAPPRFFAADMAITLSAPPKLPIEALLLQIENHVRLEHAAAESFLAAPDPVLLHSRTVSPLAG